MYLWLIYLHIISAIVTIGPFFALVPLISKIKKAENDSLSMYLETFTYVVWLSKHGGHVLVTTGVLLVWLGEWSWTTPWIIATILVMMASLYFLARSFTPTIRKFSDPNHHRQNLVNKLTRSLLWYVFIMLLLMWFMVAKPMFGFE